MKQRLLISSAFVGSSVFALWVTLGDVALYLAYGAGSMSWSQGGHTQWGLPLSPVLLYLVTSITPVLSWFLVIQAQRYGSAFVSRPSTYLGMATVIAGCMPLSVLILGLRLGCEATVCTAFMLAALGVLCVAIVAKFVIWRHWWHMMGQCLYQRLAG